MVIDILIDRIIITRWLFDSDIQGNWWTEIGEWYNTIDSEKILIRRSFHFCHLHSLWNFKIVKNVSAFILS